MDSDIRSPSGPILMASPCCRPGKSSQYLLARRCCPHPGPWRSWSVGRACRWPKELQVPEIKVDKNMRLYVNVQLLGSWRWRKASACLELDLQGT